MMRWLLLGVLTMGCAGNHTLTRPDQLEAARGQQVTLRGTVSASKIATLLGVDVESEAPDLRGRLAEATGVLERTVVTEAELDAQIAREGQVPNRGAGTFWRLVDPSTGRLAQVHPPR